MSDLAWTVVAVALGALLLGGGVAEIAKRTIFGRLKERATDGEVKRWWWGAVLAAVASSVGSGTGAVAMSILEYHPGIGAIVGAAAGVNAWWLWQPLQRLAMGALAALGRRLGAKVE
ncbi:MAG: hypothetical protein ABIL09_11170 [Gemmatimonadota bacterium]